MKRIEIAEIEGMIVTIRGHRVITSPDLARIYGVEAKVLNQSVKRNARKFPPDFMFKLDKQEAKDVHSSRSQFVTLKRGKNLKYTPYAFTEHGAIMAANILKSQKAVLMSVLVVRTFITLRQALLVNKELERKLGELELRVGGHDGVIRELVLAIRRLAEPLPSPPRRRIGFNPPGEEGP